MLQVINLKKTYGTSEVLKGASYTFKRGHLYVLVGNSGSGKSTFLHLIAKLIKRSDGEIRYQDQPLSPNDVTLVMQQPYFLGDISIKDNLRISELFSKTTNKTIKRSLLKAFGLEQIMNRKVSLCSGGEKARANIIRGLMTCCPIILIDEPTAHLDALSSERVASILSQWSMRCIMIVTTHQPQFFHFSNSHILTLDEGILRPFNDSI